MFELKEIKYQRDHLEKKMLQQATDPLFQSNKLEEALDGNSQSGRSGTDSRKYWGLECLEPKLYILRNLEPLTIIIFIKAL